MIPDFRCDHIDQIDIGHIRTRLDLCPVCNRVALALRLSSQFVEYAAYESALQVPAAEVAELITLAARLDIITQRYLQS